jgi:hypothetical protein
LARTADKRVTLHFLTARVLFYVLEFLDPISALALSTTARSFFLLVERFWEGKSTMWHNIAWRIADTPAVVSVEGMELKKLANNITNTRKAAPWDRFNELPPELVETILSHLDNKSLASFGQTNRQNRLWVVRFNRGAANQVWDAFGFNPREFFRMLEDTESVVAGPVALSLVLRLPLYHDAMHMIIYAPQNQGGAIVERIIGMSDYKVQKSDDVAETDEDVGERNEPYGDDDDDDEPGDIRLWNSKKYKIDIYVSQSSSAMQPLFSTHNTSRMSFVSAYGFICPYPALTLRKRAILNAKPGVPISISLNSEDGWSIKKTLYGWKGYRGHICGEHSSCSLTMRNIHDQFVMFMEFAAEDGVSIFSIF